MQARLRGGCAGVPWVSSRPGCVAFRLTQAGAPAGDRLPVAQASPHTPLPSVQIQEFGQCPRQLFRQKHPQRLVCPPAQLPTPAEAGAEAAGGGGGTHALPLALVSSILAAAARGQGESPRLEVPPLLAQLDVLAAGRQQEREQERLSGGAAAAPAEATEAGWRRGGACRWVHAGLPCLFRACSRTLALPGCSLAVQPCRWAPSQQPFRLTSRSCSPCRCPTPDQRRQRQLGCRRACLECRGRAARGCWRQQQPAALPERVGGGAQAGGGRATGGVCGRGERRAGGAPGQRRQRQPAAEPVQPEGLCRQQRRAGRRSKRGSSRPISTGCCLGRACKCSCRAAARALGAAVACRATGGRSGGQPGWQAVGTGAARRSAGRCSSRPCRTWSRCRRKVSHRCRRWGASAADSTCARAWARASAGRAATAHGRDSNRAQRRLPRDAVEVLSASCGRRNSSSSRCRRSRRQQRG